MYQILCDGVAIYDPRDDELILTGKKCKIGSNICGEASFTILANHPHYDKLKKLRSVFEIRQDNDTIFRGRMTDASRDFDNMKDVDLEGAMAYLNDSVIRPFSFPKDFPDAATSENVIEYFFRWIIEQHNSQVEDFQKFKVGKVTVTDPNNYISRSSSDYANAWATMKGKLFDSALGGYLCIRYEADGNYLDYLADYADDNGNKIVNSQVIEFGKNLLDFKNDSDGKETYSAVIPLGKKDGNSALTISSLPDSDVTDDIVKKGDTLYSKKAVEEYGWILAPTSETTFSDVTLAKNLLNRGVSFLESKSSGFLETITMTAMDLHLTDDEIEAFRIYKYVAASSAPHDSSGVYPLSELTIDMDNPQNTKIKVGETKGALTDKASSTEKKTTETAQKVTEIEQTYTEGIGSLEEDIGYIEEDIGYIEEDIGYIEEDIGYIEEDIEGIEANIEGMNSYIEKLDDRISLVVTESNGEGIINSAEIIAAINNGTSSVSISANKIDLTAYAKTADVEDIAEDAAEDVIAEISLTATNLSDGTSSTIRLTHKNAEIASATINFTGLVTFTALSTEGQTSIHGKNIKTGTLSADVLAANANGYIDFADGISVDYISGLKTIYWGQYGYITKGSAEYSTPMEIYSYTATRFSGSHPVYYSGGVSYPLLSTYNMGSYIDTTAKFG